MGSYTYLNSTDFDVMKKVSDIDVQKVFDEALEIDKSLMIWEHSYYERPRWYKKKVTVTNYYIYHECFDNKGNSTMQAREQLSAGGSKSVTVAYLYGIMNGYNINKD